MRIRVEANSLNNRRLSGVGYYTQLLIESLAALPDSEISTFDFNFLNRQPVRTQSGNIRKETNQLFPLRVYAKLQSHRAAFPFDMFLKPVDLTIFTNFARWPSVNSKLTATVIHDLTFIKHPEHMEKNNLPHLQRVVGRAIKQSDFIITVSESVKKELMEAFGIESDDIVVTPIPPPSSFLKPNPNDVHKKYGIKSKRYLLFLSTIEPRKNLPLLIKAYEALPKKLRDEYELVVAGGMGWKSESSSQAIDAAREKKLNVSYIGYVDDGDRTALYQQASLFVMPSIYEGFGMPILEAAASGTPVVATDIPVLREAGGEGVLYFKPSVESLSAAMNKVLSDQTLAKDMIRKAKRHLEMFSWEQNARKIQGKAEELLKAPR